jgi:hypothetical protein
MTLQYVRPKFEECAVCKAKPWAATLCHECLERRELYGMLERVRSLANDHNDVPILREVILCKVCQGEPRPECPEHGR